MQPVDILKDEYTPDFQRFLARSKLVDEQKAREHEITISELKNTLKWETKQMYF